MTVEEIREIRQRFRTATRSNDIQRQTVYSALITKFQLQGITAFEQARHAIVRALNKAEREAVIREKRIRIGDQVVWRGKFWTVRAITPEYRLELRELITNVWAKASPLKVLSVIKQGSA